MWEVEDLLAEEGVRLIHVRTPARAWCGAHGDFPRGVTDSAVMCSL
jgi:hypothetical protein